MFDKNNDRISAARRWKKNKYNISPCYRVRLYNPLDTVAAAAGGNICVIDIACTTYNKRLNEKKEKKLNFNFAEKSACPISVHRDIYIIHELNHRLLYTLFPVEKLAYVRFNGCCYCAHDSDERINGTSEGYTHCLEIQSGRWDTLEIDEKTVVALLIDG